MYSALSLQGGLELQQSLAVCWTVHSKDSSPCSLASTEDLKERLIMAGLFSKHSTEQFKQKTVLNSRPTGLQVSRADVGSGTSHRRSLNNASKGLKKSWRSFHIIIHKK